MGAKATDNKIIFKYTSRSRPNNFFRGLNSIVDNCESKCYEVLCTFDLDDASMNNDFVKGVLLGYDFVKFYFGVSISKIDAINRDLDKLPPQWDILVNMSDDMVFIQYGFDNIIRKGFEDNFSNGDGFLHFHDGCQKKLATMSIIDKKHFDRFGYIYHPYYLSVYADNEAQEAAIMLGCYHFMGDDVRILEHLHPLHRKSILMDAQYQRTESFYEQDRRTYNIRKSFNFGLC
jgi:hypothetical protein